MANISVRVPDEVRKYKEQLVFGLTARQLICTVLALVICVPLFIFGKKILPEDVIAWAVILVALPLLAIGYINIQGLPMEKYAVAWFKFEWLFPRKRKYAIDNVYRDIQDRAIREEMPKSNKERKLLEKQRLAENAERIFLMYEAEQNGVKDFDPNAEELLTVRKKGGGSNNKGKGDNNKKDEKKKKKTTTQIKAEEIQKKLDENPEYVPTAKDRKILQNYRTQLTKERKKVIENGKKKIKRTNQKLKKRRTVSTTVPKSVQKSIPILADYDEGVFEVQPNKYSKMYRLRDINYKIQQYEEGVTAFLRMAEFHNYFSEDTHYQIVIDKRVISKAEQERKIFFPYKGDKYDRHRKEYNNKILRRAIVRGHNDMMKEIFLVVTIDADDPFSAIIKFHSIDDSVKANVRAIGSTATPLTTDERLEYFHDKFRRGREGELHINYEWLKENAISSLDEIAPSFMHFDKEELEIDGYYYRTLYLTNLPASLSDEILDSLSDNNFPTTISLSVEPLAQDKALKLVLKQMTGIEMNKIDAEKRAIKAGYNPETIKHSIKDAYSHIMETYDDLLNKNQKLFFVSITAVVGGETLEQLDDNCNSVINKARKFNCQMNVFKIQQEEGWKMTLPFGYISTETKVDRSLTTEALAVFMPFSTQELYQKGGFYYGLNNISKNLIIIDRTKLKTPSGFVLGTSGSGKSFATKRELLSVLLQNDTNQIIIIDPENEYTNWVRAFGGTTLTISSTSDTYMNPMDMSLEYGLEEGETLETVAPHIAMEKALKKKSEYILSIIEAMVSKSKGYSSETEITPQQRTIIDRAVRKTYEEYVEHGFDAEYIPTLLDLQNVLDKEKASSLDAKFIAEGVEYFTKGSVDIFSHKTNVKITNRLLSFEVRELTGTLRQIGLQIIFDYIWNRMTSGQAQNIKTYVYVDEVHVMFKTYTSADYLAQLYKRGRKYGLVISSMTQNVSDLLKSELAQGMITNADFIMMLNQSNAELALLAPLLNISDKQKTFVQGAKAGDGLIFAEKVIVPFTDEFPSDTYLFKLMTTKFDENLSKADVARIVDEIMSEDDSADRLTMLGIDNDPEEDFANIIKRSIRELYAISPNMSKESVNAIINGFINLDEREMISK